MAKTSSISASPTMLVGQAGEQQPQVRCPYARPHQATTPQEPPAADPLEARWGKGAAGNRPGEHPDPARAGRPLGRIAQRSRAAADRAVSSRVDLGQLVRGQPG